MLGAIIGDMVGSMYEFNPIKSKTFNIFNYNMRMTDDSLLTIEVAKTLINNYPIDYSEEGLNKIKKELVLNFHHAVHTNLGAGWGAKFFSWAMKGQTTPYDSYGNGSAMRISPVGWIANSEDEVKILSKTVSEVTHNHPEGIKGAQTVALAIYVANCGRRCNLSTVDIVKNVIKECVEFSGYNINIKKENVINRFDETCQGTVPVALWIISQSSSFEDAIRKAVSLGADADTLGAIVGSIAEALWGIPEEIKVKALSYLDDEMKSLLLKWRSNFKTGRTF